MQEATDPRLTEVSSVELPLCGYCDQSVDPTLHLPCPTCGAHAHDTCLVSHGGCPTPGCEVTGPVARSTVAARTLPPFELVSAMPAELRAARVRRGVSLLGGFAFTLGSGGVFLSLVALGSASGGLLGVAGIVSATTLVALGSWMHALVTLFGGRRAPPSLRTISSVLATLCLAGGVAAVIGSTMVIGLLEATLTTAGLRQGIAAAAVLLSGAALVLSGGAGLAVLVLDAARNKR